MKKKKRKKPARRDPRGRTYYWMTYQPPFRLEGEQSDVIALSDGYITVTPLHFDLTRYDQLDRARGWDWSPAPGDGPGDR